MKEKRDLNKTTNIIVIPKESRDDICNLIKAEYSKIDKIDHDDNVNDNISDNDIDSVNQNNDTYRLGSHFVFRIYEANIDPRINVLELVYWRLRKYFIDKIENECNNKYKEEFTRKISDIDDFWKKYKSIVSHEMNKNENYCSDYEYIDHYDVNCLRNNVALKLDELIDKLFGSELVVFFEFYIIKSEHSCTHKETVQVNLERNIDFIHKYLACHNIYYVFYDDYLLSNKNEQNRQIYNKQKAFKLNKGANNK